MIFEMNNFSSLFLEISISHKRVRRLQCQNNIGTMYTIAWKYDCLAWYDLSRRQGRNIARAPHPERKSHQPYDWIVMETIEQRP